MGRFCLALEDDELGRELWRQMHGFGAFGLSFARRRSQKLQRSGSKPSTFRIRARRDLFYLDGAWHLSKRKDPGG